LDMDRLTKTNTSPGFYSQKTSGVCELSDSNSMVSIYVLNVNSLCKI